jgi:hypothetical protein
MSNRQYILGREDRALEALADNENGAEYEILKQLAETLLSGEQVAPMFQVVVNAIVAKAVLCGRLPLKKRGRPESIDGVNACDVAIRYFELVDNGCSYEDAVTQVADSLHKDKRHVMRLVKAGKQSIGSTPEQRMQKREWWAYCGGIHKSRIAAGEETLSSVWFSISKATELKNASRDPIAELDALINGELESLKKKVNGVARARKKQTEFRSSQRIKSIFEGVKD